MDWSRLQELAATADSLMRSATSLGHEILDDDSITIICIANQLRFLRGTLSSFPRQGSIDRSSLLEFRLEACEKVMFRIKSLFDGVRSQSDNRPRLFRDFRFWPEEQHNKLEILFEDLQVYTNSLSLALDAGLHLGGSGFSTSQGNVNKEAFDLLSEQIKGAASQIFRTGERGIADFPGFTVSELMIASESDRDSTTGFTVICPRACIFGTPDDAINTIEFRCCCEEARHKSLLRYKRWTENSLLKEEICLDGNSRWSVTLLKSDRPVVLRLSDIPRFCVLDVEALAGRLHQEILNDKYKSSALLMAAMGLPEYTGPQYKNLEWTVKWVSLINTPHSDAGFPGTKIRSVSSDSHGLKKTICNPSIARLRHHRWIPRSLMFLIFAKSIDEPITIIAYHEPYIRLFLEDPTSFIQRNEVLVTKRTRISHENNPLGRLVVTLIDAVVGGEFGGAESGFTTSLNFSFDDRKDAETFARYVTIAQDRLRQFFVSGPMLGERPIYFREFSITTMVGRKTMGQLMIVAQHFDDRSKCTYRALLSKGENTRNICFEINTDISEVALKNIVIWVSDYDRSGRPTVSQTTWKDLIQQEIIPSNERATLNERAPSNERATFVRSGRERTAGDWLEEIDKLIMVLKRGKNDTVKDRYMKKNEIVYKDFTNEPRNDSWHGTCCTKIISDIYEEAVFFIARIFEKDHANEKDGPIRMAKAIDWAINPPNRVDIISISAGFRHYSEELDEAVTSARAAGILVVAAAANWQNTGTVAFPARHNLSTMCIYSTNVGNQSSSFNPEPRSNTSNFAILGEGFQHPDQRRSEPMNGTSMATAVAVGLAANIIDFSRQEDNKSYISRSQDVGKLPGMLSIFSAISKPAGPLRYVAPLELLPLQHGSNRERDRQRVREILSQAMERAN